MIERERLGYGEVAKKLASNRRLKLGGPDCLIPRGMVVAKKLASNRRLKLRSEGTHRYILSDVAKKLASNRRLKPNDVFKNIID